MILRKKLLIALMGATLIIPVKSQCMETLAVLGAYLTPKVITACLATGIGLKWLRTADKSNPTLEKTFVPNTQNKETKKVLEDSNQVKAFLASEDTTDVAVTMSKEKSYILTSGFADALKDSPTICIALGGSLNNWGLISGYKNWNPGAYSGYRFIKSGIVDMPCVTFDCVTDNRRSFNFCQEQDLHTLDLVVKKIRDLNKNAKIVLTGICKGGSLALRYVAEKAEKNETDELNAIKAIVVEGPPNLVKDAIKKQPGYPISLGMAKTFLPNFDSKAKTILQAKKFPNIPVLVGTIPTDTVCNYKDVISMVTHLKSLKDTNLRLLTSYEKISHSAMTKSDPRWQKYASAFVKEHITNTNNEQKQILELKSTNDQSKKTA